MKPRRFRNVIRDRGASLEPPLPRPRKFAMLERVWNDMRRPAGRLETLRGPLRELRQVVEEAEDEATGRAVSLLVEVGLEQIQLGLDQTEQILQAFRSRRDAELRRFCDVLVGTVEHFVQDVHNTHHTIGRTWEKAKVTWHLLDEVHRNLAREFEALRDLASVPGRFTTLCSEAAEAFKKSRADSPEAFDRFLHGARAVLRREGTPHVSVQQLERAISGHGRAQAVALRRDLRRRILRPGGTRPGDAGEGAFGTRDSIEEAEALAERIVELDPGVPASPERIDGPNDYLAARQALRRAALLADLGAPGLGVLAAALYLLGLVVLFRPSGDFEVQPDDTPVLVHPRVDAGLLTTLGKGWVLQCVRDEVGHCVYRCSTDGAWFQVDLGETGWGWLRGAAIRSRAAESAATEIGALEGRCAEEESDREYRWLTARARVLIQEEELDTAWWLLSKALDLPAVSDRREATALRQVIASAREAIASAREAEKGEAQTRRGLEQAAMEGIRCRTRSYLADLQEAPTSRQAFLRAVTLEAEGDPRLLEEDARRLRHLELQRTGNRRRFEARYVRFEVGAPSMASRSGGVPNVTVELTARPRSGDYTGPARTALAWRWAPDSGHYVLVAPLKESQDG